MFGKPTRIAMWSGPRNISTALMRSFEARGDTVVTDEPLYAYYLSETGHQHPGRAEVLASQPHEWQAVVERLAEAPCKQPIWYQKHMAHHLRPAVEFPTDRFRHAFLIRDPAAMLRSLNRVLEAPDAEETGLPQQVQLFDEIAQATGVAPPVIDGQDVLADPRQTLMRLCERLNIEWTSAMLSWAPGPRTTDGVWAEHWYARVEESTGFEAPRPSEGELSDQARRVLDACQPLYDRLAAHRLR